MSEWNKERNFQRKCVLGIRATIRNRIACHYSEKLLTTITLCNVFYGASFCFIPHYFRYFCASNGGTDDDDHNSYGGGRDGRGRGGGGSDGEGRYVIYAY